ncbi:MAG: 3-dehydroquinate synthase II [Candidatus Aureabacteria bacterium]|nr:3-dehydroquinate synthase II [Candidatus Auribacterota bacterium]
MAKKVWIDIRPWSKKKVIAALEAGADAVIVSAGMSSAVKKLGRMRTVAVDGDIRLGRDVAEITLRGKADEIASLGLSRGRTVIVSCPDWTVIPLENLVAQSAAIMAAVKNRSAARTALGILEKGVAGVVVRSDDPAAIAGIVRLVKTPREKLELTPVRVTEIRELGMGDRVCVDTCTAMGIGEGMLVGNAGSALFLIHSESVENPFVRPRPFRVNAGALHAYTMVPGGKTVYLSELSSGDEVLIVDHRGRVQPALVGRVKAEKRPMLLVRAGRGKREASLVLQNAETIRLVRPSGKPVSVAQLKKGDEVLVRFEGGGRHFGMKVKESIIEK